MTSTSQTKLSPRLHGRLAAYTAATGAVLTVTAATLPSAQAVIVNSGAVNIAIPNTADGIYLNFVTGSIGTTGAAVTGYDWNPYGSGTSGLLFFWGGAGSANAGVATTANGPYLVLATGSVVGPAATYSLAANGANNETAAFKAGVNGYLGVRFLNEATSLTTYGYVHLQTTGALGFPATILDYSYETSGAAITVVPEPTTTALLGAMALGAVGVRQWRRRKTA